MIGNDVIDLALARKQSNWQRKGLLEKIFTPFEQQLVLENGELMFWNLWSRKEAAYKIYHRETRIRLFNPQQFECDVASTVNQEWLGMVNILGNSYYTKTTIDAECINTVAVLISDDFNKIKVIQSEDIFKDSYGIPFKKISKNPVSISHHGRFEKRISLDRDIEPRF